MEDGARAYVTDVWVDGAIYRRFSVFDAIIRTKKWRRPALFAGIFCAFAVACFLLDTAENQGGLLGGVLLAVGLFFPLSYFGIYFYNLEQKIKKLQIKGKKRRAYRVTLSDAPDGVAVDTGKQTTRARWKDVYMVCRRPKDIYLYIERGRAYILPAEVAGEALDDIWQLMIDMLPKDKRADCRKGAQ